MTHLIKTLYAYHRPLIQRRTFPQAGIRSGMALLMLFSIPLVMGEIFTVQNSTELRERLAHAKHGNTLRLEAGNYGNGILVKHLSGSKESPIVIEGANPENPPLFEGGKQAIHFVDCNYITLRNIRVSGCSSNGINVDDGGSYDSPSQGMVFENIHIENIGPKGNFDGLKLSGLIDFTVRKSQFSGWGGSAIDMVGCREGLITDCTFEGKAGYSQNSGIQTKGGSENIRIILNTFKQAGQRAVNLGGSTGDQYFRPELRNFEARNILVAGNQFEGSQAPIAFVSSVDCVVRQNTFRNPGKWVVRILQEKPIDSFLPCQKGRFEGNLIFADKQLHSWVNIGPNTLPESFVFDRNCWVLLGGDKAPTPTDVPPLAFNEENPATPDDLMRGEVGAKSFQEHPEAE